MFIFQKTVLKIKIIGIVQYVKNSKGLGQMFLKLSFVQFCKIQKMFKRTLGTSIMMMLPL